MKMSGKYKVYVDDNYHYMDKDERYPAASYDSLEEALQKCREIVIRSLEDLYEKGIIPENLSAQWSMFGEDPFITGAGGGGPVPFSARKFVTAELCQGIIENHNGATGDQ